MRLPTHSSCWAVSSSYGLCRWRSPHQHTAAHPFTLMTWTSRLPAMTRGWRTANPRRPTSTWPARSSAVTAPRVSPCSAGKLACSRITNRADMAGRSLCHESGLATLQGLVACKLAVHTKSLHQSLVGECVVQTRGGRQEPVPWHARRPARNVRAPGRHLHGAAGARGPGRHEGHDHARGRGAAPSPATPSRP